MAKSKTEGIRLYIQHYKKIKRSRAISHYSCYDLPDVIRRLKRPPYNLKISAVPNSDPDTEYVLQDGKTLA